MPEARSATKLRFDADDSGSNEASALSDDPNQPGPANATVVGIAEVVQVPMLDPLGLLITGLLLALSGDLLLRCKAHPWLIDKGDASSLRFRRLVLFMRVDSGEV